MRFMMVYKSGRETDVPPSPQEMAGVGQLLQDRMEACVFIASDGVQPNSQGVRVRISGKEFLFTDGPFAETKELIGG